MNDFLSGRVMTRLSRLMLENDANVQSSSANGEMLEFASEMRSSLDQMRSNIQNIRDASASAEASSRAQSTTPPRRQGHQQDLFLEIDQLSQQAPRVVFSTTTVDVNALRSFAGIVCNKCHYLEFPGCDSHSL